MRGGNRAIKGRRIAIIEDDHLLRESLAFYFQTNGFRVETFGSAREVNGAGSFCRFDVVISDYMLSGEDGISLLRRMREESKTPVMILATAHATAEVEEFAKRAGVDGILHKPFSTRDLEDLLLGLIGSDGNKEDDITEVTE